MDIQPKALKKYRKKQRNVVIGFFGQTLIFAYLYLRWIEPWLIMTIFIGVIFLFNMYANIMQLKTSKMILFLESELERRENEEEKQNAPH